MTEQSPYGSCGLVDFKSFRDRLVFIAIWNALFSLRFTNADAHIAAQWLMVLWRVLRYQGSDNELQADKFLGPLGTAFDTYRIE